MCLNETYNRVRVGKHLTDMFPAKNDFIQGDALSRLLFSFVVEYAIIRVQVNQDGLKLNGTHQLLVYAYGVNISGESLHTMKKNMVHISFWFMLMVLIYRAKAYIL